MWRGEYNTDLHFLTFFEVTGKWRNYSDSFFADELEYQSHFFLSRPGLRKFYVKSLKGFMYIDKFKGSDNFMFEEVFHFLGSQGESYGRVSHHMKIISLYNLLFKEIGYYILMLLRRNLNLKII